MALDTEFWVCLISSSLAPLALAGVLLLIMRRLGLIGALLLAVVYAGMWSWYAAVVLGMAHDAGSIPARLVTGVRIGAIYVPAAMLLMMLGASLRGFRHVGRSEPHSHAA